MNMEGVGVLNYPETENQTAPESFTETIKSAERDVAQLFAELSKWPISEPAAEKLTLNPNFRGLQESLSN